MHVSSHNGSESTEQVLYLKFLKVQFPGLPIALYTIYLEESGLYGLEFKPEHYCIMFKVSFISSRKVKGVEKG